MRRLLHSLPLLSLLLWTSIVLAGDPAVDKLVSQLKSSEAKERVTALDALTKLGAKASSATSAVLASFHDSDDWVRIGASRCLAAIGKAAVPALTKALAKGDDLEREGAAMALALMGKEGAMALPQLSRLLQHSSPRVRLEVLGALFALGSESKPAIPALIKVSRQTKSEAEASHIIAVLRAVGESGAADLAKALGSKDKKPLETLLESLKKDTLARIKRDRAANAPPLWARDPKAGAVLLGVGSENVFSRNMMRQARTFAANRARANLVNVIRDRTLTFLNTWKKSLAEKEAKIVSEIMGSSQYEQSFQIISGSRVVAMGREKERGMTVLRCLAAQTAEGFTSKLRSDLETVAGQLKKTLAKDTWTSLDKALATEKARLAKEQKAFLAKYGF